MCPLIYKYISIDRYRYIDIEGVQGNGVPSPSSVGAQHATPPRPEGEVMEEDVCRENTPFRPHYNTPKPTGKSGHMDTKSCNELAAT